MNQAKRQSHTEKSQRVTVLLPPALHERVCREADHRLLSRSAVIRETLVQHFRHRDEEQRP